MLTDAEGDGSTTRGLGVGGDIGRALLQAASATSGSTSASGRARPTNPEFPLVPVMVRFNADGGRTVSGGKSANGRVSSTGLTAG